MAIYLWDNHTRKRAGTERHLPAGWTTGLFPSQHNGAPLTCHADSEGPSKTPSILQRCPVLQRAFSPRLRLSHRRGEAPRPTAANVDLGACVKKKSSVPPTSCNVASADQYSRLRFALLLHAMQGLFCLLTLLAGLAVARPRCFCLTLRPWSALAAVGRGDNAKQTDSERVPGEVGKVVAGVSFPEHAKAA